MFITTVSLNWLWEPAPAGLPATFVSAQIYPLGIYIYIYAGGIADQDRDIAYTRAEDQVMATISPHI